MICPKCKENCSDDAKYCRSCGTDLESYRKSNEHKKMTALKWAAGGCVCAAALAVGLFAWQTLRQTQLLDYMEAGYAYMEEGDYSEAVAAFTSAAQIDPKQPAPYNMLAAAYTQTGDAEMAAAARQEAANMINGTVTGDETGTIADQDTAVAASGSSGTDQSRSSTKEEDTEQKTKQKTKEKTEQETEQKTKEQTTEQENEVRMVEVNDGDVQGLLQTFSVPVLNQTEQWYDDGSAGGSASFDYSEFDSGQVYTLAALALIEDEGEEIYENEPLFCCLNNVMYPYDGEEDGDQADDADGLYIAMSDELCQKYDQYMDDLFGGDYSVETFDLSADQCGSEWGVALRKDEDGQPYLLVADLGTKTAVKVGPAFAPDESGNLLVLTQYTNTSEKNRSDPYYMLCEIVPDDTSGYGYVAAGIIPAGRNEPDWDLISERIGAGQDTMEPVRQKICEMFGITSDEASTAGTGTSG